MVTRFRKTGSSARAEGSITNPLSLENIWRREVSPLNEPVWRAGVQVGIGILALWALSVLGASGRIYGIFGAAAVGALTWFGAVRLLLTETRFRKFWVIWLVCSLPLVFFFRYEEKAWAASVAFSLVFLLVRRYRPYRHLTSRRRSFLFVAAFVLFLLLTVFWKFRVPAPGPLGTLQGLGFNIIGYSVWSLRIFLVFTMLALFLGVRLHFMKIKPKLAVSALILTFVPVALLLLMELVVLYAVLGESRAVRASAILNDWASLSASDQDFSTVIAGETTTYHVLDGRESLTGTEPAWMPDFVRALQNSAVEQNSALIPEGSGVYFWREGAVWLVTVSRPGPGALTVRASPVDVRLLDRLAAIVRSDVIIMLSNPIRLDRLVTRRPVPPGYESDSEKRIRGRYVAEGAGPGPVQPSLWTKRFYFGMTHLNVVSLGPSGFETLSVLLSLQTSVSEIVSEIFSARNPLGVAFVAGIAGAAGMMFVFEILALIFGLRVATGITSAVKSLHQGTKRIGEGDLETKILIPNEDELGDLAAAFNEMSAAVKRGREEAVAREKLERELKVGREIQERLLPHIMPNVPGFEISGTSLPSQQVSGDYFDFLEMESGRLGIAVADVSGKGIPAALLMANLQASLHGQAVETGDADRVVEKINNLLARSTDDHMFATFFYGILNRIESRFTYTNAGHNPPFLFHRDGSHERLGPDGLLIGFLPNLTYRQKTIDFRPEDVLVLFTDGITEAVSPSPWPPENKYFGEDRLAGVIRESLCLPAAEIQAAILQAVAEHTGGGAVSDDITLVVIKRKAAAGPALDKSPPFR